MFFALVYLSCLVNFSSSVIISPKLKLILSSINCGCDRVQDLDVLEIKVNIFNLETNSSDSYFIAEAGDKITARSDFDNTQCIQMFVPGILNSFTDDAFCILSKIDCQGRKPLVIIIDHSKYTSTNIINIISIPQLILFYKTAVKYTKSVGVVLGKFLVKILDKVDRNLFDVIGHSLGAHIMGYMSEIVQLETNVSLARIYATDAAGPCFDNCPNEHVKSSQADLVVSFHCNAGLLGSSLNIADYDIYSFNGVIQETCGKGSIFAVPNFLQSFCSHGRCVPVAMNPAIDEDIWNAVKCNTDTAYLNGDCNNNESTLVGYRVELTGSPGVYYMKPTARLDCNFPQPPLWLPGL